MSRFDDEPPTIESVSQDIKAIRRSSQDAADYLGSIYRLLQMVLSGVFGAGLVLGAKYYGWI